MAPFRWRRLNLVFGGSMHIAAAFTLACQPR
jgi:hypothetical protein